jgi:hypothetical protein
MIGRARPIDWDGFYLDLSRLDRSWVASVAEATSFMSSTAATSVFSQTDVANGIREGQRVEGEMEDDEK